MHTFSLRLRPAPLLSFSLVLMALTLLPATVQGATCGPDTFGYTWRDQNDGAVFDVIDFVIHSIAYADRKYLKIGKFHETPRDVFLQAMDISAYTLVAIAQRAVKIMPNGGSIVGLSYYGGEKVIPGYNVMGVAKAALEMNARYLSSELGEKGVRVNIISAGPLRTLSAMAVGGIEDMFEWVEKKSPLRRNIDVDEVGKSAVYLVSDLSAGVTGETLHVDAGFNIIGL